MNRPIDWRTPIVSANVPAATTLAAWRARETELRARNLHAGVGRPEQVTGRSGMEVSQSMRAGELPRAPISETRGFVLVEVAPGHAEFQGAPKVEHYNPLGSVHGGWMATLLDSHVGCAVHSRLPPGKAYTTLERKVKFVKALTDRAPLVRAVGDIIHFGSRVGAAVGRLVGPDGTLYAHATTTCLIFDAK
jgi:uncharacterized protein (TIGR00369 family)